MFSKASIFLLLAALSAPSSKMIVTLTCDHRQIYGADADLVLKEFIAVMGSPEQLLCRYIRSGLNRPQYISLRIMNILLDPNFTLSNIAVRL
jgi:hypothetical protein